MKCKMFWKEGRKDELCFCFFYGEKEEGIASDIAFSCCWEPGILGGIRGRTGIVSEESFGKEISKAELDVDWKRGQKCSDGLCLNFFLSTEVYQECKNEKSELLEEMGENFWVCTRTGDVNDFDIPRKIVLLCEKEEEGILFGRMVASMLGIRGKEPRDPEEYLLVLKKSVCWLAGLTSTREWSEIRTEERKLLNYFEKKTLEMLAIHVDGMEYLKDAMYQYLQIQEFLPEVEILFGLGDSLYGVKVLLYLAG